MYDVHGNVDTLLQDFGATGSGTTNIMNANGHRFKKMVYKYDLISGKVNMMQYQPGLTDQLIHRYAYDAKNRLTQVETSLDSIIWDKEARYEYYKHGPLARVEVGHNKVQGIDYAYTLQVWLKGVNSSGLRSDLDMGRDGDTTWTNRYISEDEYNFSLNCHGNEYAPINGSSVFPSPNQYFTTGKYRPLYNGNISSMTENLRGITAAHAAPGTILYNYRYDQLNRIKGMEVFQGYNPTTNSWLGMTVNNQFKTEYTYDGNGNIQKLLRHNFNSDILDSLNYHYYSGTNRLKRVADNISASLANYDVDNQNAENNYVYDEIGNIISDDAEKLTNIKWNVYGKITEITHTPTTANTMKKTSYMYDASGKRISKTIEYESGTKSYVWYVLDAQGNTLTTYTASGTTADPSQLVLNLSERYTYGSSRLGAYNYQISVDGSAGSIGGVTNFVGRRGTRKYELTNHLGNVLTVLTDRKIGVPSSDSSLILSYKADPIFRQSYYPFGMGMATRGSSASTTSSRYGFNGKENDNEVKGTGNQQDYGMRIYDPRLGRFLSLDPISSDYPWYTPYQFAGNKPISSIDLDGAEDWMANQQFMSKQRVTALQVQ